MSMNSTAMIIMAMKPDSVSEVSAFMTCSSCNRTTKVKIDRKTVEALFGSLSIDLREVFIEAHGECIGAHADCNVDGCRAGVVGEENVN